MIIQLAAIIKIELCVLIPVARENMPLRDLKLERMKTLS